MRSLDNWGNKVLVAGGGKCREYLAMGALQRV